MRIIYKYVLKLEDEQIIKIPKYSDIIKVDHQQEQICMWVDGRSDVDLHPVKIRIIGTGRPIPEHEDLNYLDTVIMDYFVWHVYIKFN